LLIKLGIITLQRPENNSFLILFFRTLENEMILIMPYSPFKFQSMKHLHIGHVGEQATLAVVIAVLYFCAISLFSYVFNLL